MLSVENGQKVANGPTFGRVTATEQECDLHVCGPRGTRTHNPRIKSPLLCQLS
jgi:hypothetical protein